MSNLEEVRGNWKTPSLGLPSQYADVLSGASDVFSATSDLLTIATSALQVAKAFSISNVDPLVTIVTEIAKSITDMIGDLEKFGLYLHSDYDLVQSAEGLDSVRGGFQEYERRMITRLLDESDPNRPNISGTQTAIAVFFYMSVSPADLKKLQTSLATLRSLLKYFGQQKDPPKVLPHTRDLQVHYGRKGRDVVDFSDLASYFGSGGDLPQEVVLSWAVAGSARTDTSNVLEVVPDAFLVEVSTMESGMKISYDRPKRNMGYVKPKKGSSSDVSQPREGGQLLSENGQPLTLYGGADRLTAPPYNDAIGSAGHVKNGRVRVYGQHSEGSNIAIPLELLKDGDKYLIQRSFLLPAGDTALSPGRRYQLRVPFEDLPLEATFEEAANGQVSVGDEKKARQYYWKVTPVMGVTQLKDVKASISSQRVKAPSPRVTLADKTTVGLSSVTGSFSILDANTAKVQDALAAAFAVAVLSRSDLKVARYGHNDDRVVLGEVAVGALREEFTSGKAATSTGLEKATVDIVQKTLGTTVEKFLRRHYRDPVKFRAALLAKSREYAAEAEKRLPGILLSQIEQQSSDLLSWKWSDGSPLNAMYNAKILPDQTILESLSDKSSLGGVAASPYGTGDYVFTTVLQTDGGNRAWGKRTPSFYEKEVGDSVLGSMDESPVVYGSVGTAGIDISTAKVEFARNRFTNEVYQSAAKILGFSAKSLDKDGGWQSLRLGDWAPDLDDAAGLLSGFVASSLTSLEDKSNKIGTYINFLEARINQIQEVIARLQDVLVKLEAPDMAAASMLLVTGDGTDGILGALVTADNKPQDASGDYGMGVVLVGNTGVPLGLISDFFSEAKGE